MLVDDDGEDAELFQEALASIAADIEFISYTDGRRVLSELKAGGLKPEIIFLDINMPYMSGWECLSLLKSDGQLCNIPVIMYSTSSVTVDGRKAIDHGASGFLEKPSSYIKLREFLEKIVAASAQEFGKELRKPETSKAHALMAAW